VTNTWNTNK